MVIAVIADIVGSRTLADRAAAQRDLESAALHTQCLHASGDRLSQSGSGFGARG